MTRIELMAFHCKFAEEMRLIFERKNSDYTGQSDDPFFNFNRVELLGIASTEQGILTRMMDKFARIGSFISQGTLAVKDESAKDTILDLANYCIILAGYLESKKPETVVVVGVNPETGQLVTSAPNGEV